ncbi:hypothetical protein TGGT1_246050 [Toxoplasma gondii GT1]|uniref:Uncharacterized protein n=3 Tax=Toxoplasma gondii TaxID=5811 RepID=S7W9G3_TOXGG|nr:hypothetical protein TGGT1_246050 [Toxoplasma gondii GT1]KAF4638440.1 hypothetical protein TGRH88_060480 [Toxoplasma gondii]RQX71929.1 hypothetical protein TGCAST_246050 [Toxoplasma gondii CAST]
MRLLLASPSRIRNGSARRGAGASLQRPDFLLQGGSSRRREERGGARQREERTDGDFQGDARPGSASQGRSRKRRKDDLAESPVSPPSVSLSPVSPPSVSPPSVSLSPVSGVSRSPFLSSPSFRLLPLASSLSASACLAFPHFHTLRCLSTSASFFSRGRRPPDGSCCRGQKGASSAPLFLAGLLYGSSPALPPSPVASSSLSPWSTLAPFPPVSSFAVSCLPRRCGEFPARVKARTSEFQGNRHPRTSSGCTYTLNCRVGPPSSSFSSDASWAVFTPNRGAKLLRWSADTPVAQRLEGLAEAKDLLLACKVWEDQMTRRDYLAALTLLTTRKRLDRRSELFLRFVDRVVRHRALSRPPYVHLFLHRFAVLGHAPALWRLAATLPPLLSQMAPAHVSVSAWSLATCFVADDLVWDEIGRLTLVHLDALSFTDVAMLAWASARMDRRKPQEILALKSRALAILEASQEGHTSLPSSSLSCSTTSSLSSSCASGLVPPHDLCMLFRAMATLLPRDLPWLLRLLYVIATSACGSEFPLFNPSSSFPPSSFSSSSFSSSSFSSSSFSSSSDPSTPAPEGPDGSSGVSFCEEERIRERRDQLLEDDASEPQHGDSMRKEAEPPARDVADAQLSGGATPRRFSLSAQALTAVWTAIADINLLEHFPLSPHTSLQSLASQPLSSPPATPSPVQSPALSPLFTSASSPSSPLSPSPSPPSPSVWYSRQADVRSESVVPSFESLFGEPFKLEKRISKLSSRQAAAGVRWLLDRLCEETRLLRLDHTVNTNMIAKIAEAMMKQKFVDPRLIYQLLHFVHKRGGEQLQPEQVLTLAKAFTALNIGDAKAWKKLAHRAQATAIDLSAREVEELQKLFRRAGCGNQRVEGYLGHFLFLKDDVERHGPL